MASDRARRLAERLHELFQNAEIWAAIDEALNEAVEDKLKELASHPVLMCVHALSRFELCFMCEETAKRAYGGVEQPTSEWGV